MPCALGKTTAQLPPVGDHWHMTTYRRGTTMKPKFEPDGTPYLHGQRPTWHAVRPGTDRAICEDIALPWIETVEMSPFDPTSPVSCVECAKIAT